MERGQWQPWLVGAIGLWLIASPYVLSMPFADEDHAGVFRWAFVGPGSLLLLLAIGALAAHQSWETGLAASIGLWLLAAPWIVGFSDDTAALASAGATGTILVVLGVWTMMMERLGNMAAK